jgi:hypothetical protein
MGTTETLAQWIVATPLVRRLEAMADVTGLMDAVTTGN